ncbi:MAG: rRNA maturation RNase YbeY [Clostridia bacterium]|nr:rRNA maturation RNase YbeY [Clostridia bacterium]
MRIIIDEEQSKILSPELFDKLEQAADITLSRFDDPEDYELSLSFVSKDEIKELNSDFRGIDKVTDVLSFPQYDGLFYGEGEDVEIFIDEGSLISLGDVVICKEVAEEQAKEYGHSFEREVVYLFTHSLLHLLGFDHMDEEDKKIMRQEEELSLGQLGLSRED